MLRTYRNTIFRLSVLAFLMLTMIKCAKTGSPTGGAMDTIPPVFLKATPPNYTTNFDGNEVKIFFDEYVKLKDYQKQLIISPPLKNTFISPQGSASKYITITIQDTLKPNTTYVFNFGQSIVDNNEGNPYSYFKYILSTGSYIDSLSVKGTITDAISQKPDNFVSIALYEVDSTYTDSIIYSERPRYVTNTLDSLTTFELTNLREGKYLMIALKDEDANFTFQPKKDKIGFPSQFITVPTDSSYTLTLFKENQPLDISRPRHTGKQRITLGAEGPIDSFQFKLLSPVPSGFKSLLSRKQKQDTLNYFFKPKLKADSLLFTAKGPQLNDTVTVKLRDLTLDTLVTKPVTRGTLPLGQTVKIELSIPPVAVNDSLITIQDKDSSIVAFTSRVDKYNSIIELDFESKENTKYNINALPGAFTDFYNHTSDSLNFTLRTKERTDYGDLEFTLLNAKNFPYIIQLVNKSEEVIQEKYTTEETKFTFSILNPENYYIRLIEDANGNKKYDTGNFLSRLQAEKVIYYPKLIEVRAGWLPRESFTLKN